MDWHQKQTEQILRHAGDHRNHTRSGAFTRGLLSEIHSFAVLGNGKTLEEAIDSAKRAEVSVGYKKESDKRIRIVKEGKGKK